MAIAYVYLLYIDIYPCLWFNKVWFINDSSFIVWRCFYGKYFRAKRNEPVG